MAEVRQELQGAVQYADRRYVLNDRADSVVQSTVSARENNEARSQDFKGQLESVTEQLWAHKDAQQDFTDQVEACKEQLRKHIEGQGQFKGQIEAQMRNFMSVVTDQLCAHRDAHQDFLGQVEAQRAVTELLRAHIDAQAQDFKSQAEAQRAATGQLGEHIAEQMQEVKGHLEQLRAHAEAQARDFTGQVAAVRKRLCENIEGQRLCAHVQSQGHDLNGQVDAATEHASAEVLEYSTVELGDRLVAYGVTGTVVAKGGKRGLSLDFEDIGGLTDRAVFVEYHALSRCPRGSG